MGSLLDNFLVTLTGHFSSKKNYPSSKGLPKGDQPILLNTDPALYPVCGCSGSPPIFIADWISVKGMQKNLFHSLASYNPFSLIEIFTKDCPYDRKIA